MDSIVEIKCPKCKKMVNREKVVKKKYICYECGGYFRVKTNNRIKMVADMKSFTHWFEDMPVSNPLDFEGYEEGYNLTKQSGIWTVANAPANNAITGNFAPHGINGASIAVALRSLSLRIVRHDMIPGIAQPVPTTIGITDFPDKPTRLKNGSSTTVARAI